ncbi:MAG: YceI family protein [Acidobacteriota bacterium]|nr:YceI family protein [Acidobacteriota bacterium]
MKSFTRFFFTLLFAVSATAYAQDVSVMVDPARSTVQFTLGDVLHTVRGTFRVKNGVVRLNPTDGTASGQIVVDARSGSSGSGMRDRRMHNDILQSDRYPDATFSPDRVTGRLSMEGESQVDVHGVLRIHGQDHEVTLPAKVKFENGQITAKASFTMPYVDWGMKNPSNFVLKVSDKVDLAMSLTGNIQVGGGPASPAAVDRRNRPSLHPLSL